jgi:hypothetical protein
MYMVAALLQVQYHQKIFTVQFSRHAWSRHELERNSLPVFWSFHRSVHLAWWHILMNRMVQGSAEVQVIVGLMQIDSQTDSWPALLSGISVGSSMGLEWNPWTADGIHRAAKADMHCSEFIAKSGSRLGGHLQWAEQQYYGPPAALSVYAGLLSYWVVEMWNALSTHH